MKTKNNNFFILSSFCTLLAALCGLDANAAMRVGNTSRSYADSYNQATMMQQSAEYYNTQDANAAASLPVRVADANLADRIVRGDTTANVHFTDLEQCAMIYPSGEFAWDRPTIGMKTGAPTGCVAVVELRKFVDGTPQGDIVVARANLSAGDSIDCNINNFSEATYLPAAGDVIFPADREPTMDDVKRVMNDEQKKNAGFKIAAGTIIGGLAGNAATKNEIGKSSLIGGKANAGGTIVGALTGAAVTAGGSYAGKVGGDVIMSTGVNAVAGGIMGNIVASGDAVLRTEDCTISGAKSTCLWGVIQKNTQLSAKETGFYNIDNQKTVVCKDGIKSCSEESLIALTFDDYKTLEEGVNQKFLSVTQNNSKMFTYDPNAKAMTNVYSGDSNGRWVQAKTAGRPAQTLPAMIPNAQALDKTFGSKLADWYKWRNTNRGATIYGRNSKGEAYDLPSDGDWTIQDFYPLTVNSSDGGVIALDNKARLGGTLIGAGTGAGLGAFSAYQGATDEVDARWISAVTEYKDSLQKFYCATGTRFLSSYNDIAVIPNMQSNSQ